MPAEPLAALFAELWELSMDGGTLDCSGLQDMLARTGLAVWREATEADVRDGSIFEVGDPLLALTEEGTRIVRAAHKEGATRTRKESASHLAVAPTDARNPPCGSSGKGGHQSLARTTAWRRGGPDAGAAW
jgi:hypothetical protein